MQSEPRRGLDLHPRAAAGSGAPAPCTDAREQPLEPAARRRRSPARSSRPSLLPFDGARRRPHLGSSPAIACCCHRPRRRARARRAGRGARAQLRCLVAPARPARPGAGARVTARGRAHLLCRRPRRDPAQPAQAASRDPSPARSSWPARPAGGCRRCARAPRATWRARRGPRPSRGVPRRSRRSRAQCPSPGARGGRDRARPRDDDPAGRRRGRGRHPRPRRGARAAPRRGRRPCCAAVAPATRPRSCARSRANEALRGCRSVVYAAEPLDAAGAHEPRRAPPARSTLTVVSTPERLVERDRAAPAPDGGTAAVRDAQAALAAAHGGLGLPRQADPLSTTTSATSSRSRARWRCAG